MITLSDLRSEITELKLRALEIRRKSGRVLRRFNTPIRPEKLRSTLGSLIGAGSELLFVHASLSNCGRFTAGPDDVLSAISEFCGTLAFPTHTYCYPSQPGETGPVFDANTTKSKTGFLTELFRLQPGVIRSIHATHSLAASGPLAQEICEGHYRYDTPCGVNTPYSRLLKRHAGVLLFGVTFHAYTLFHTAEDAAGSQFAYEAGLMDRLSVVDETGGRRYCYSRRQSREPRRFTDAGGLLERVGLARRITLGRNDLLFVPDSSRAHDFLLERLKKVPDLLYQSCASPLG